MTCGETIATLNDQLFRDLAADGVDRRGVYDEYLRARSAGYMRIESGSAGPVAAAPWAALTGYDKIALQVVRAIHLRTNAIIPLNVLNDGALRDLNEIQARELGHPETLTRIAQYELAYRMQVSVPEAMDITRESKETLDAYGAKPGESRR